MSCNCNNKYDNKIPCCCSTGPAIIRVTTTTTTTIAPSTTTTTTLPCICLNLIYNNHNNAPNPPAVLTYTYKNCSDGSRSGTIIPGESKNFCGKQITSGNTDYYCEINNLGPCSAACTITTTTTAFPLPIPSTTTTVPVTPTTIPPITTTTTFIPINFDITSACVSNAGNIVISNYVGGSGNYQISSFLYTSSNGGAVGAAQGSFMAGGTSHTYTGASDGNNYVGVRDVLNPINVTVKSVNIICYTASTTSTTTTTPPTTTTTTGLPITTTTTTEIPNQIELRNEIVYNPPFNSNQGRPWIFSIGQMIGNSVLPWSVTWSNGAFSTVMPGQNIKGVYGAPPGGYIILDISPTSNGTLPTYGYPSTTEFYYAHIYVNNNKRCTAQFAIDAVFNRRIIFPTIINNNDKIVIVFDLFRGNAVLCY